MPGRVVVDVSSLVRWFGPPVGIMRVEHAIAHAAIDRAAAILVVFDERLGDFRLLNERWQQQVIGWSSLVDTYAASVPYRRWLTRLGLVTALERWRLSTISKLQAHWADRLQRAILALRPHRYPLLDGDGGRVANLPVDMAFADPAELGPDDVLFFAGAPWGYLADGRLGRLKAKRGFRIASMCFDLIPITHPEWYPAEDSGRFRRYWSGALPLMDVAFVTARCIARDVGQFCGTLGIPTVPLQIVDLGYDPPAPARQGQALPGDLEPLRYALFVSTIEPRKGHALLIAVWRRLLARGIPQRHRFRLVLAGRPGWMVDDILQDLATPPDLLVHLDGATDQEVAALYEGAAFCCYPSHYEGYGLPIIEAFARGKAVIASTGGAVPETVNGLSPCLDPDDLDAWEATLADWIQSPGARRPFEERIAASFSHPTWPEAADRILQHVLGLLAAPRLKGADEQQETMDRGSEPQTALPQHEA